MKHGNRTCVALSLAHALGITCAVARAQPRDLHADLSELNVRHTTAHYTLAGTVPDAKLAEFGRALEFIHTEYVKGFESLSIRDKRPAGSFGPKGDAKQRFRVIILATNTQYAEFGEAYFGSRAEHTRGLYVYSARLLLICASGPDSDTFEILFHEAFHQFLHRYVPAAPPWLHEGLATHYGTARPTRDGLVFDRPKWSYRNTVLQAANAHQLIDLGTLLELDAQSFYATDPIERLDFDNRQLAYAQAYTLSLYLLKDAGGRQHFQRYIQALAEANSPRQAREIGREKWPPDLLHAMSPQWLDSVKRWR